MAKFFRGFISEKSNPIMQTGKNEYTLDNGRGTVMTLRKKMADGAVFLNWLMKININT